MFHRLFVVIFSFTSSFAYGRGGEIFDIDAYNASRGVAPHEIEVSSPSRGGGAGRPSEGDKAGRHEDHRRENSPTSPRVASQPRPRGGTRVISWRGQQVTLGYPVPDPMGCGHPSGGVEQVRTQLKCSRCSRLLTPPGAVVVLPVPQYQPPPTQYRPPYVQNQQYMYGGGAYPGPIPGGRRQYRPPPPPPCRRCGQAHTGRPCGGRQSRQGGGNPTQMLGQIMQMFRGRR